MKKPYLFGVLTVLTLSSLCAHAMEKETDDDAQFTGVPVFYPAVLDRHEFMESISDARPLSLKKEQFLGVYRKDPYLISNEAIAQLNQGYNPNYSQMILLVKNDKYNENGVKYPIPKAGMYVYEVKEFGQWEKYGEEFNITFLHEEAAQQIEALLPKEVASQAEDIRPSWPSVGALSISGPKEYTLIRPSYEKFDCEKNHVFYFWALRTMTNYPSELLTKIHEFYLDAFTQPICFPGVEDMKNILEIIFPQYTVGSEAEFSIILPNGTPFRLCIPSIPFTGDWVIKKDVISPVSSDTFFCSFLLSYDKIMYSIPIYFDYEKMGVNPSRITIKDRYLYLYKKPSARASHSPML